MAQAWGIDRAVVGGGEARSGAMCTFMAGWPEAKQGCFQMGSYFTKGDYRPEAIVKIRSDLCWNGITLENAADLA